MDKEHMKTNKFKEDEKRTSQKKKKAPQNSIMQ